jgi:hypothetical protein
MKYICLCISIIGVCLIIKMLGESIKYTHEQNEKKAAEDLIRTGR